MLLWYLAAQAAACAVYECQDLNQDICAKRSQNTILLNSLGCTAGLNCTLSGLLEWETDYSSPYFLCEEIDSATLVQHKSGSYGYHCGERLLGQNLHIGGHPKQCSSDSDCMLESGALSACGCSFHRMQYCVPQWDSNVFDGYWSYCKQNDGKIYDFADIYYWIIMKETYTYQQDSPDCAHLLFTELIDLTRLEPSLTTALVLSLSLQLLIAL